MGFTLDEAIARTGPPRKLLWLCGLTQTADAMELLVVTFLESQLPCAWPHVAKSRLAVLTMSVFAGMLLGAMAGGAIADRWGRRVAFGVMTGLIGFAGLASAAVSTLEALCT